MNCSSRSVAKVRGPPGRLGDAIPTRKAMGRSALGDLARGAILFGEQLEDLAPGWIGERAEQGVLHGERYVVEVSDYFK